MPRRLFGSIENRHGVNDPGYEPPQDEAAAPSQPSPSGKGRVRWFGGIVVVAIIIVVVASGSSNSSNSTPSASSPAPTPASTISKQQAEVTFRHRFAAFVGGEGQQAVLEIKPGSVEESCTSEGSGYKCTGVVVVPASEDCFYLEATITKPGHINPAKESTGRLPLGEPGVSECKI